MNGRERVLSALGLRIPDVVPVLELGGDEKPDKKRSGSYDRYYTQIFQKLYESMKELNHKIHHEFC
jgi:hypothetical protein